MNKRRVSAVVLGAMVLTAAASASSVTALADDDKTITYWNIATEGPDKEIMSYAVDQFNENTESGYKVEVTSIQNDNYKEKLVIAMSSGECPDMYTSWTGGPMIEYVKSGFAKPVDELAEKYGITDRVTEGALAQGSYDGHLYGIPYLTTSVVGFFYNTEIFEKYGLEAPSTFTEFEAVCDTLVENGVIPMALVNLERWPGSQFFMYLAARYGGIETFRDAAEGKGTFEDESFIKAGDKFVEWINKGYFPEGTNSLSWNDGQAKQLFYTEQAAMLMAGSGSASVYKNDSEEFYNKLSWFPFPYDETSDQDPTVMIGTLGDQFVSFNCEGEKLDAAVECVSYYSTEDGVNYSVERGKIPPTNGVDSLITEPVLKTIVEYASKASNVQLYYDQYLPPAVAEVHLATCQQLIGLTMTSAEAAAELQAANEAYLAENEATTE